MLWEIPRRFGFKSVPPKSSSEYRPGIDSEKWSLINVLHYVRYVWKYWLLGVNCLGATGVQVFHGDGTTSAAFLGCNAVLCLLPLTWLLIAILQSKSNEFVLFIRIEKKRLPEAYTWAAGHRWVPAASACVPCSTSDYLSFSLVLVAIMCTYRSLIFLVWDM